MSNEKIDLSVLDDLPKETQKVILEELARLSKQVNDLDEQMVAIEKETMKAMSGMSDKIWEYACRLDAGPFYVTFILNEISIGFWGIIDDGYLTVEFNFLFFTLGINIPLGIKEDEDE